MASETEADSPIITNYNRFIPEDVLEDLCSRFLINIPDEERADVVRLCFQIELAHWFYIDFYRQENPDLPGCGIKEFTRIFFNKFPFLNKTGENVDQIFANWRKYKLKVPVFGAILINQAFDKCLLVQPAMSKTSWGFPKGKVNKDEEEFDCAIREVLEETGFDMTELADPNNYIEHKIHDHPIRLYVVPGVPENTPFQPQTRGEIRDIQWFEIEYLPTHKKDTNCTEHLNCNPSSFFMVIPFVKDLRKRMSYSFTPRPNSQNSRTMADENIVSTPKAQLQKLVDKEEARIENEKKQAAMDRRRKLQQEKFMAQHALNHPLRSRGYQSPVHERDSPSAREQDEKTPSPIKILQRPEKLSSRDRKESRDRKTGSKQKSFSPSSLHQFVEGSSSRPGNEAFAPFSPIYHAPVSSYSIHPTTGSLPAQPASPYGVSSSIWHLDPSTSMDPLTKLRLLSANASSTHTSKPRTAVQEDEPLSSNRFCFSAPAFENFKFDRQAFSDIL